MNPHHLGPEFALFALAASPVVLLLCVLIVLDRRQKRKNKETQQ